MDDLISRKALIDVFAGLVPYVIDGPEDDAYARGLDAGYQALVEAPAVDAEPVRRGRWVDKKVADDIKLPQMQEAKCSVCGKYLSTPYVYYWTTYNYCPHCGAKNVEAGE